MSFLRNFRNNIVLDSTPSKNNKNNNNKTRKSSAKSVISERGDNYDDSSRYNTYSRKSSGNTLKSNKSGRDKQAPIIVYVDKNESKKPGILRTNTFTKNEQERPVTRSNTFTINETDDERITNSNTYTKRKDKTKDDVFEPLYSKNIRISAEKLPVVIDTRTYRKKSVKSSKPAQKVESFIRRFEKSIFGNDRKSRKTSRESSDDSYVPQFRDIGIECKLDEEERLMNYGTVQRRNRMNSRDSLIDKRDSSSSQRSHQRERSMSPQKRYSREYIRSSSPQKRYERESSPEKRYSLTEYEKMRVKEARERSVSPSKRYEIIEFKKSPQKTNRTLEKKKEQELGYSTIDKKRSLSTYGTQERNKSILVNNQNRNKSYSTTSSTLRVGFDSDSGPKNLFRGDTYNTLKEEYETTKKKPVGIASPRLSSSKQQTTKPVPKKDQELPKYTFGTNHLEERRSRFQDFQKSFPQRNKTDESESEITYKQSFFVPI